MLTQVNRNKKSVALSFKHTESLALLKKIIETSDVVVENYIPGTLKKYGLDYPALAETNPGLVYASITGKPGSTELTQATVKLGLMPQEQVTTSWSRQKWD